MDGYFIENWKLKIENYILMKPHITLLLGTAREGRLSEHVAHFLLEKLKIDSRFDIELVDVRDHLILATIASWTESDKASPWREIVKKSDAFIIVSPEYNHGYPGELKLLLDRANKEYFGKPVLMCGVSNGPFGGARMIEHIIPILRQLGMVPLVETLYFPHVSELFKKNMAEIELEHLPRIEKGIQSLLGYIGR